ncbi:MAG: NYN domain-containing protein [Deltaproteobacteria bacterium]
MPYLVDGNNVMAQTVGWHRDRAAARKRLIRDLARFVAIRKVKVRVVFDGSPDDEFPEGRKYKSVLVLYAKQGSDADSRIKGLVDKSTNKRDITVVSSDKALGSYVAGRGAKVLTS